MARALWKGFLTFGAITFPAILYTAVSSAERVSFNILNRRTGNKVRREYVDSGSGEPVERDAQVKGYEVEKDQHIIIEPDEIAAIVPESDKTIRVSDYIPNSEIDTVFLDKSYYLIPDKAGEEAFVLLRDALVRSGVAAIAHAVLFRRLRTLLIRPHGNGLIASTMNFDYEVRSAEEAFEDAPKVHIEGEMLDLAKHIIATKKGTFNPKEFDDRYDTALMELVQAKAEGRTIKPPKEPKVEGVSSLLEALRESVGVTEKRRTRTTAKSRAAGAAKTGRKTASGERRKAG
ncbi:DNA end-binding protein Ku [Mycoplana sp. BE70]|uniref:non-homologous end joining protein Ku n=1 Tax=Mycoplana sp. BE70 TaxID=2817775 RepID=UPI0028631D75|nr:Ku protein [Mycoplana sp. BE70]MDR6758680.1 DNA end-binding protein Ku [Mycoplana sp. BE70]